MSRPYVLPLALLSGACSLRPWTPSVSVAFWSQDVPANVAVALPDSTSAIARWQLPPANPWARYQKFTLLSSLDGIPMTGHLPDVRALEVFHQASVAGARAAGAMGAPDVMFLVDMRGAASVAFGSALERSARGPVALVPTFGNWPCDEELVPAEETLAAMLALPPTRRPEAESAASVPVFLLDAWRLAYRFDQPDEFVLDNRYVLAPSDLPDPSVLRGNGITRVVYVVEKLTETEVEEDDLHQALLAYQDAGIALCMVDLEGLAELPQVPGALNACRGHGLSIEDRETLLDDPGFYHRARGGFGGLRAGPSPFRYHSGGFIHGGGG